MSSLKMFLLGPPRVELAARPIDIQRRKALALFIYLAVSEQRYSRDALATMFWPDHDQRRARAYLRRDLAALNKALPGDWLVIDRETVGLNYDLDIWVDANQFRQLAEAYQASASSPPLNEAEGLTGLAEAATLYRDEFLAGFTLRDSPEFDEWQFFQREDLSQTMAQILRQLVQLHQKRAEYEAATAFARRLLTLDPMDEPAHRLLMHLYNQAGQQAAALRQYQECVRILDEELGVSPEEETTTLFEAIKAQRLVAPLLRDEGLVDRDHPPTPLPLTSEVTRPSRPKQAGRNLPAQTTPFVGRQAEREEIKQLLLNDPNCRLLTLAGPGGIGKTRLALAVAQEIADSPDCWSTFPDGIAFVPLAAVDSPGSIISATAEAVGLKFQNDSAPEQQLFDYLREKRHLLVLDNFEHLIAGVGILSDMLAAAPEIKILTTSREALNLQEAWCHVVGGLLAPSSEEIGGGSPAAPTPATFDAAAYDAVKLFEQCAQRAQIGISLQAHIDQAARICRLVDGTPLAIELAASWLKVLTVEDVANEIERSLDILTARHQNVPERHRSMRAVMEQSWALLSPDERTVLQQLSVFRGGFRQEAAATVAGASLLTLAMLAEKSFLRIDETGRYQVHELLRQLAAEKLEEAQQTIQTADRHCHYYLTFLIEQEAPLHNQNSIQAIARLKDEVENIRQGWQWAVRQGHESLLARAVEPLAAFLEYTGQFSKGEELFGQAVERLEQLPLADELAALRCHLIIKQVTYIIYQGHHTGIEARLHEAKKLAERCQDELRLADIHYMRAITATYAGELNKAAEEDELAARLYEALGNRRYQAAALNHLGERLSRQQKADQALAAHEQALQIGIDLDNIRVQVLSLSHMGVAHYYNDDYAKALEYWERAVTSFEALEDKLGMGRTLNNIGHLHNQLGNYERARHYVKRSISLLRQIGDQRNVAFACDTLGDSLFGLENYVEARKCYQHALEYAQRMDFRVEKGTFLVNLTKIDIATGHYDRAEGQLRQAQSLIEKSEHPTATARILATLGQLYQQTGRLKQALAHYDQAVEVIQQAGEQGERAPMLVQKAALLMEVGQLTAATELAEEGLSFAIRLGLKPTIFQAKRLMAQLAHAQTHTDQAVQQLQALLDAARTEAERASIHDALWQIQRSRTHAQRGLEIYRQLAEQTANIAYQKRAQALQAALTQRYVQETLIATGGMGEVYQGRDTESGQRVAIKRLKPELVAQNPEAVNRLIREGEALRQLNHPNIVKVLATIETEGQPLIVMEYLSGGSLRDLLKSEPQLPLSRVLQISLELADALARAHHLQIIHRDLKPANILLTEDGAPRLTDFGVANLGQQYTRLTQEGAILGTVTYMSPEAWRGEALDPRSDIWSFGALMFEMLAGRPPFVGKQITATLAAILNEPLPDLQALRPDTPPALVELLKHMLVKERDLRIDSMRQVAAGLEVIRRSD